MQAQRAYQYQRLLVWVSIRFILCGLLMMSGVTVQADSEPPTLKDLTLSDISEISDGAQFLSRPVEDIPVRVIFGSAGLNGYVFLTDDIAPIPAYSGRPVSVLVAIDLHGKIVGAQLHHHEEPILVVGVNPTDLEQFIDQYAGFSWTDKVRINAHDRPGYLGVDGISGATITAMVINRSIMKSVATVARHFGLKTPAGKPGSTQIPANTTQPVNPDENSRGYESDLEENYWLQNWWTRPVSTVLLCLALVLLLGILFFQDWLVIRPALFNRVRVAYLVFTVLFTGYYLGAQLSIMNILAFAQRIGGAFSWEVLLLDPSLFLLWSFVAVTILLWGRGVFCGWLCPFGALQDLIYRIARVFGLPEWEIPSIVHERLWAIKYFILIALVGLSLDSVANAARLAEVEPFKTSFSLFFQREWWFVLYALILLGISVFNSKFYCKYICPLGAALSIGGRYQIFEWLRRRNECGKPCKACASDCQIDAIKPTGQIVKAECHYCLQCQVLYWDDRRCPPLAIDRRKKESRAQKVAARNKVIPAENINV